MSATDLPEREETGLVSRIRQMIGKGSMLHKAAALALLIKLGAAVLGFGSQIVWARLLGADQYGVYSYYWICVMVAGTVTTLGLSEAAPRFIAAYRDRKEYGLAWGYIFYSFLVILAFSVVVALIGSVIATALVAQLDEGQWLLIVLALACFPLLALQYWAEGAALSFSWTGLAQIPPFILRQVLVLIFAVTFVLMIGWPATAQTAMIAMFLALLISLFLQLILFFRRTRRSMTIAPAQNAVKEWMVTSFPMLLTNGFQLGLAFSDIIILGLFVDPATVALYFAATRISSQVIAVHFAVTSAVLQRLSGLFATGQKEELHALVRKVTHWIFWPTTALTAGILLMGWPILWMFGEEFTEAYGLLPILALGLLMRASTGAGEDLLKMTGHERVEFGAKAACVVVNITMNFALIPLFGSYGAAAATTISLLFYCVAVEVLVRRKLGFSSFILTLKKPADLTP